MKKVVLVGAGDIGVAIHTTLAQHTCCGLEPPAVQAECVQLAKAHSFEATYYPTQDEVAAFEAIDKWGGPSIHYYRALDHDEWPAMPFVTSKAEPWSQTNPRYASHFTKKAPLTNKARKAARRRAKAGRRASR